MKKLLLLLLLSSLNIFADPYENGIKFVTQINAIRVKEHITIDGILNESVWNTTPSVNVFVQRDPVEGASPSQKTDV